MSGFKVSLTSGYNVFLDTAFTQVQTNVKKKWSERRDLNPRPLSPQNSALPGCATFRYILPKYTRPPKRLQGLNYLIQGSHLMKIREIRDGYIFKSAKKAK